MTQSQAPINNTLATQLTSALAGLPWTALDVAWLQFLKSHQATPEPLHELLALWSATKWEEGMHAWTLML